MIPSCHTTSWYGPIYLHSLLTQISPVQHVKHTAWRANDDVWSLRLEFLHFIPHVGASNAGMARSTHVVTQGQDNLLNLESKKIKSKNLKNTLFPQVLTFNGHCALIKPNTGQVWPVEKVISIRQSQKQYTISHFCPQLHFATINPWKSPGSPTTKPLTKISFQTTYSKHSCTQVNYSGWSTS